MKELTVLELFEMVVNKELDRKYLLEIKQLSKQGQFDVTNELDDYINSIAWIDEEGNWHGDVDKFDTYQEVYQYLLEILEI